MPTVTARMTARAAWFLAVVGVVLAAAHALRPAVLLADSPLTEDGYYALAVARHAALGQGLTVDGVHPTDGFHPLWVGVNVPLFTLCHGDRVNTLRLTLLLGTALWIAFAWTVARMAVLRASADGASLARAMAFGCTLGSYAVFRVFHNGLETGLVLVLLALAVQRLDDPARRTSPVTALVLTALVYARLDAIVFVVAATVGSWLAHRRLRSLLPEISALAGLAPWLARNLRVDGHLVPTSGRAESAHIDLATNLTATLAALGQWAVAPMVRLPLWSAAGRGAAVLACVLAVVFVLRSRCRLRGVGVGHAALGVHLLFLIGYYTLAFGAPHFQDRYLAPVLVPVLPAIAVWLSTLDPRRGFALVTLATVLNGAFLALSLAGAGTLGTSTWHDQTTWVLRHVEPPCTVGAGQSGALGYFRDRVVNLDGKVNADALQATRAHALRAYVDGIPVDVVVDWPCYVLGILGGERRDFHRAARVGAFEVWVRDGRDACLR